jgi:Eco47II restriction endonuclease
MKCSICKQEGHNKRSCKKIITQVSALKIEAETDVKVTPQVNVEMDVVLPPWYKIHEINKETYLMLIKPLYDIIEGKKESKSEPDLFAQQCLMSFHNMTKEEWDDKNKKNQIERAWTMAWGNFHQSLMGSFPDWINYKTGHETGCDIGRGDNTCVAEIKNNTNTMNSSSKESVFKKLKKQRDLGKRALLVVINGDIKKSVIDGIEQISGRQFYEELSGRPTFRDDLLETTNETFKHYKTFEALKAAL